MRRVSVRILALVVALVCSLAPSVAQPHARADFEFGHYLLGSGLLRDARTLAEQEFSNSLYTPAALDSLSHLKGWTLYNLRDFEGATAHLGMVGNASPLYPKSAFFGAVSSIEKGDYSTATNTLTAFAESGAVGSYGELLAFEQAGLALLRGDAEEYKTLSRQFTYGDFALADEERTLDMIAHSAPRNLSPWVAGVASAVVPGLGQIYAGNIGEGVASFLLVGAMAALTAESWAKADSPANLRTILYGSVGALLYVGNICGSVASVKIYHQQFNETRSEAVVCSLHIPLRAIFK